MKQLRFPGQVKKSVWICICLSIIVIAVVVAVYFKSRPMIESINNPRISFISVTLRPDGVTKTVDIPEEEIPTTLSEDLLALFLDTNIRNTVFPPPETYHSSDGSVHITVKITLDHAETLSMLVNLCTIPEYNSAQFGDTHYHIINHQKLYQDVYLLLSDVLSASAANE